MTKAILINSANRSLTEIEINDWTEIAPALGCQLFTIQQTDSGDLYLDDEGLMNAHPEDITWFAFDGVVFAGNGLLFGPADAEGDSTDAIITVEEAESLVSFGRPINPTAYVDRLLSSGMIIQL
jgi:hypothetical protein